MLFESFIEQKEVESWLPKTFNWVFFSSPASVQFYLQQFGKGSLTNKKIASIGMGTSHALKQANLTLNFEGLSTIVEVAESFKTVLTQDDHVLFPISSISRKSIQKTLHPNQYSEVITYKSIALNNKTAPDFDVIAFTSPSNIDGFFQSGNTINQNEAVFCIGASTKNYLKTRHGIDSKIPYRPNMLALMDSIRPYL